MKTKLKNIKKKFFKVLTITRNIVINASKEFASNQGFHKISNFIKEYRFYLIIGTIIVAFISKNIYTLHSYNLQIETLNDEIVKKRALNEQLKEDLIYYNSDEYIIRCATEELNLRLSEENKLFHGEIFPIDEHEINENTSTNDEAINSNEENDNLITQDELEETQSETHEESNTKEELPIQDEGTENKSDNLKVD